MPIRLATPADAAAVAEIYRPHVQGTVASFELVAPDAAEMGRRITEVGATHPWLVAEASGAVVGYAYATRHRPRVAYQWCTEVSVYVREGQRGAGIGRRLYAPLLHLLFLQGFVTAYAVITLPNAPSVAFHERLGFERFAVFERIGYKLGDWRDVGWYRRLLRSHPDTPGAPLSMPEVLALPAARELLDTAAAGQGWQTKQPP